MFNVGSSRVIRAGLMAAIVVTAAGACSTQNGSSGATTHASAHKRAGLAQSRDASEVQTLVSGIQAAKSQHDVRATYRMRARLTARLGKPATQQIEATYEQVLTNLRAADAAHDWMAAARYRNALRELCSPAGLTSALVRCDAALAAGAN